MVQLALAFVAASLVSVQASPFFVKRIAQVIDQSMVKWEAACDTVSKGSLQCNQLAVAAFQTLLANAGPCDQQNAADNLVDFSKQLNSQEMVAHAQIFCQQPRNSPNSVSIPYCQQPPRNPELNGLFQCQFIGSKSSVFVGNLAVGAPGTIPRGMTSPLNPLGSCPAHPQGPIADGTQLSDIATVPFASGGSSTASVATDTGSNGTPPTHSAPSSSGLPAPSPATSAAALVAPPSSSGGFKLQNGLDAQSLNLKFSTLDPNSPCDAAQTPSACLGGKFAQCANGKFVLTPCSGGLQCFALPLVNSRGTSITCDTEADALSRISASGAKGGITGQ